MASFVAWSSFCIVVALFCFTLNVEAREGKLFFNKFTHLAANKELAPTPIPAPLSPAPSPAPAHVSGRLGDGHFGPGSGMIPQTKDSWPVSSTTSDEEFDKLVENFDDEKTDKFTEDFEVEEDSEDSQDTSEQKGKYYNNNKNAQNKNNKGYTYSTTSGNYKSNDDERNVRGYGEERQGMSDTRFMESGKYFYDVKGQSYENTPATSNYNEDARGFGEERQWSNGEHLYGGGDGGNDENTPSWYESSGGAGESFHPNEYETMEEYYKSLEDASEESMP